MSNLKVACWNIYFSHKLIEKQNGRFRVAPHQRDRAENVAEIIRSIDADIFGIIECMPSQKLRFFVSEFLPGYAFKMEGDADKLNIGILYNVDTVSVKKLRFSSDSWNAAIGYGGSLQKYKFSRIPLITEVSQNDTGKKFIVAIIHAKSKKTYTADPEEPYTNRKKIIAQCLRIRELMASISSRQPNYRRFIVMGDINDGPGFDKYEAKLATSGVEALAGNVFKPDDIYHSFVDLTEGGVSTTPFSGAPQLDHILFSRDMTKSGGPQIKRDTGKIRSDLVDFQGGSGKEKDSDHIPVEIEVAI